MKGFQVVLTEHAITDLEEVSTEFREQIQRDLQILQTRPLPSGTQIKRLKGFRPPIYRLRPVFREIMISMAPGAGQTE